MGARGPARGSEAAKAGKGQARGTLPASIPPPPSFLGAEGRGEYERIAAVMVESFTAVDFGPLMLYAADYEQVIALTRQITQEGVNLEGDRGVVLNPAVKALDMAQKRMLKSSQALGLTRKAASATPNVELSKRGARRRADVDAWESGFTDWEGQEDYEADA